PRVHPKIGRCPLSPVLDLTEVFWILPPPPLIAPKSEIITMGEGCQPPVPFPQNAKKPPIRGFFHLHPLAAEARWLIPHTASPRRGTGGPPFGPGSSRTTG